MKRHAMIMTGIAGLFCGTMAMADCAADLAKLEAEGGAPAGDGTNAMEAAPGTTTGPAAREAGVAPEEGGPIAKDGTHTPLEGATTPDVATSAQDAQTKQDAAEGNLSASAALDRDREALPMGDEAACVAAVSEARAS